MSIATSYDQFARYYDAHVSGFFADVACYRSLCSSSSRILEVGCGSGRLIPALLEAGGRVVGIDSSAAMLAIARHRCAAAISAGDLILKRQDIRSAAVLPRHDSVLFTFFTFNYLLRGSDQRAALRNACRSLRPGGTICLDMFFPSVWRYPHSNGQWQVNEFTMNEQPIKVISRRHMDGDIERRAMIFARGKDREIVHTSRRFVPKHQLQKLLLHAGFTRVRAFHDYDLETMHDVDERRVIDGPYSCVASRG